MIHFLELAPFAHQPLLMGVSHDGLELFAIGPDDLNLGWPLFGLAQLYRAQAARAPSREA
jgi:hypothetical protein